MASTKSGTTKKKAAASAFKVGDRCINASRHKGTVRYVGSPSFAKGDGTWIGVELDTKDGNSDGSVKGEVYFECAPGHGIFAKPATLKKLVTKTVTKSLVKSSEATTSSRSSTPTTGSRKGEPSAAKPVDSPPSESKSGASGSAAAPKGSTKPSSAASVAPSAAQAAATDSSEAPSLSSPGVVTGAMDEGAATAAVDRDQEASSLAQFVDMEQLTTASKQSEKTQAHLISLQERRAALAQNVANPQPGAASGDATEANVAALEKEINALKRKLEAATSENTRLNGKVNLLDQQNKEKDKKLLELEEKKISLEGMAEILTLDLQVAQESVEDMEGELKTTKAELTKAREDLRASRDDFMKSLPPDQEGVAKMTAQNKALTDALRQLRDLNLAQKAQFERKEQEYKRRVEALTEQAKEAEKLKQQINRAQAQNKDLQESLDEASESVDMVERMAEKNLALSERVDELEGVVKHQKALLEMSEEVEESYRDLEKQMRDDVANRTFEATQLAKQLKESRSNIADLRNTIRQFRIQNGQLKTELEELKLKEANLEQSQFGEAKRKEMVLERNLKLHQQSLTSRQDLVKAYYLQRVEVKVAEIALKYFTSYIPKSVNTDKETLLLLLVAERLECKATMLIDLLGKVYGQDSFFTDSSMAGLNSFDASAAQTEMTIFTLELATQLTEYTRLISALRQQFKVCSESKKWKSASTHWRELLESEKMLDFYTMHITNDTLTHKTPSENIESATRIVRGYLLKYFGPNPKDLGGIAPGVLEARLLRPADDAALLLGIRRLLCAFQIMRTRTAHIADSLLTSLPRSSLSSSAASTAVDESEGPKEEYQVVLNELEDKVEVCLTTIQRMLQDGKDTRALQGSSATSQIEETLRSFFDPCQKLQQQLKSLQVQISATLSLEARKALLDKAKPTEERQQLQKKIIATLNSLFAAHRGSTLSTLQQQSLTLTQQSRALQSSLEAKNLAQAAAAAKTSNQGAAPSISSVVASIFSDEASAQEEEENESLISVWRQSQRHVRMELEQAASVRPSLLKAQETVDMLLKNLGEVKMEMASRQVKIDVLTNQLAKAMAASRHTGKLEVELTDIKDLNQTLREELKTTKLDLKRKENELSASQSRFRLEIKKLKSRRPERVEEAESGRADAIGASVEHVALLKRTLAEVRR